MNDVFKVIVKFFNGMKAWFVNIEIKINSPTIIYNMSKAINELEANYNTKFGKILKQRIKELNEQKGKGTEKVLNRFIKTKGL